MAVPWCTQRYIVPKAWYFCFSFSLVFVCPYLNLYFSELGFTSDELGYMSGIRPWVSASASFLLPAMADRFGIHTIMIVVLLIGSTILRSSLYLISSFAGIVALTLATDFVGASIGVFVDATIVAGWPDYGVQRAWASIGWGALSPVAGYVIATYGWGAAFLISLLAATPCLYCGAKLRSLATPQAANSKGSSYDVDNGATVKDERQPFQRCVQGCDIVHTQQLGVKVQADSECSGLLDTVLEVPAELGGKNDSAFYTHADVHQQADRPISLKGTGRSDSAMTLLPLEVQPIARCYIDRTSTDVRLMPEQEWDQHVPEAEGKILLSKLRRAEGGSAYLGSFTLSESASLVTQLHTPPADQHATAATSNRPTKAVIGEPHIVMSHGFATKDVRHCQVEHTQPVSASPAVLRRRSAGSSRNASRCASATGSKRGSADGSNRPPPSYSEAGAAGPATHADLLHALLNSSLGSLCVASGKQETTKLHQVFVEPIQGDIDAKAVELLGGLEDQPTFHFWEGVQHLLCDWKVLVFLLQCTVTGFGIGVIASFLFLFVQELGGSSLLMGLMLTFNCAAEVPVFANQSTILKHIRPLTVVHIALGALVLRCLAYTALPSLGSAWWVLPIELLQGISYAAGWGAATVHSKSLAPPPLVATMNGIMAACYNGVGQAIGGLVGGLLYGSMGARGMFATTAAVVSVGWAVVGAAQMAPQIAALARRRQWLRFGKWVRVAESKLAAEAEEALNAHSTSMGGIDGAGKKVGRMSMSGNNSSMTDSTAGYAVSRGGGGATKAASSALFSSSCGGRGTDAGVTAESKADTWQLLGTAAFTGSIGSKAQPRLFGGSSSGDGKGRSTPQHLFSGGGGSAVTSGGARRLSQALFGGSCDGSGKLPLGTRLFGRGRSGGGVAKDKVSWKLGGGGRNRSGNGSGSIPFKLAGSWEDHKRRWAAAKTMSAAYLGDEESGLAATNETSTLLPKLGGGGSVSVQHDE